MFGKVVQLLGNEFDYGFKVIYGIHSTIFKCVYRHNVNFAEIIYAKCTAGASRTYIHGGHHVEDKGDGFKKITVYNGFLEKKDKEEYLLVIIPYANYLKTNATRIAGRYPQEAILEMHAGDIVEVSKTYNGYENLHVFMVVEAGNELLLIEKTR